MTPIKICICLLLFISACTDNNLETITETNELGHTLKYQRDKTNFARQGWFETIDTAGILIEKAHYLQDTLDGKRILFYENGDTNIVETYSKGAFDGPYELYYEQGQLKMIGHYVDNEMTGDWVQYYEDGQVKEKVQFEDNQENGPFVEYHPNGKIATEGQYADGDNEQGELKMYNEEGILSRIMMCDKGRCATTWSLEENQEKE